MTTRPKLDLELNKPTEIILLFDTPITGDSKFGSYAMYGVNSGGQEFSFFPVSIVHEKLKNLKKGDHATIIKTAAQQGNKLVTNYQVNIPSVKQPVIENEIPANINNTPAAVNPDTSSDRLYDIMLKSYQDALKLNQELGGMIDPTRIAITLFIARNGRMGSSNHG